MQSGDALFGEPPAQATDLHDGVPDALRDLDARQSLGHEQYRSHPAAESRWRGGGSMQPFEFRTVGVTERDRAHAIGHGFLRGACHGQY